MHYQSVRKGIFLDRPNRFIAHVDLEDGPVVCHVKNTGRCRELLLPGSAVWVQDFGPEHTGRKTRYDLIAVEKKRADRPSLLINMDSQAPNKVFQEWAEQGSFLPGLTMLRPEHVYHSSRFDFYYETATGDRGFVEVKGVTLEENGTAAFPDAPTQRGIKHLDELGAAVAEGYKAHVCFVLQMEGMTRFCPNERTHPAFGEALRRAASRGVEVFSVECAVTPDALNICRPVPLSLSCVF